MSKIILKKYRQLLKHMKYYNLLSAFPVYDTEYMIDIDNKIKEIMSDKTKEYDALPVVACKHCKNLHIVSDELDNSVCMRCGSRNELKEFINIYEYQEYIKRKDE